MFTYWDIILTLINVVLHQYMFAVCRIVRPGMEDYTEPLFNGSDAAGDSFVEGQANWYTGKHSKVSLTLSSTPIVQQWFHHNTNSGLKYSCMTNFKCGTKTALCDV